MDKSRIWIVIPAYSEAKRIGAVLEHLKSKGYTNLVVVNDGSNDNTAEVAAQYTPHVLIHAINRGAGAATKTGLEYVKQQNPEVVVTLDADGQHSIADLESVIQPILAGNADVVIGSRMLNPKGMPWIRQVGNLGLNIITFFLFGLWVSDSQSGFKAFSASALEKINIKLDRYEFCSEMIHEIRRNKLRCVEVPIKVIYTQESYAKGQSVIGGIKTFWGMIKRKMLN